MDKFEKKTRSAFLWTSVLKAPFWTLYGLLIFILYKDLHATAFQVAVFLTLKPVVSVFSIYWSAFVNQRRDRLIKNIIAAALVGYLPFFFFPFVDNPWFFIASGAIYMMVSRGIIPAWMEILKLNIPAFSREKVFSYGSAISYLGAVIFPLLIGDFLDVHPGIWRWFFPCCALLSLGSLYFLLRIPIPEDRIVPKEKISLIGKFAEPWKNAWNLFSTRQDFRNFQIGFFLGGAGLMVMQPALPQFFFGSLNLSYTELAVALSVCKGIGFTLTTRAWTSLMSKINIYRFSGFVTVIAALFPLFLLCAKSHLFWLYFSYGIYGVMQAGSEMSWHLSGPIFAKKEDSSIYSSVNVATVGLRGCIAPFLGSLLCSYFNSSTALVLGSILCLLATFQMNYCSKRYMGWARA